MTSVLDASVALKWVLPEPDSPRAEQLREDFRQNRRALLAPDVFPLEVGHALARAERRGILAPPEGSLRLADILATLPVLHSSLTLLARAFTIASAARIGVYDCLYVALAEREGCSFVTADDRLIRALQPDYPFIVALASLP